MILHLADPVSCRKYSGAIVFTAPSAELSVMLFIVPLNGYTIVASAVVVTPFSSLADGPDSACGSVCVAMSCGGGFSWWYLRFCLGQCEAGDWNYFFNYFQYLGVVGCFCMLNSWFSSNDENCADNYNFSLSQ